MHPEKSRENRHGPIQRFRRRLIVQYLCDKVNRTPRGHIATKGVKPVVRKISTQQVNRQNVHT